jgi:zinc protease
MKRIARRLGMAGCALALAWLAPAPAFAKVFEPEAFTLGNGMQVVVISDHRAPVVGHWVWYRVGAADAPYGKSGISHFFEHLMFKGTPNVPPGEFSKIIARNGGRDNAFTSQDYTAYFQNVARDRLELVMRLEADRMANLVLTEAEVTPELQVVLEERLSRTDNDPGSRLGEQMTAALYLNHPYGRPIIGWEHELRTLGLADAQAFYLAHYAPNNAILIVSGDVTVAEVKPLAEKYYGVIPPRPVAQRQRPQEPPRIAERRVVLQDAAVRQPSVSRSYHAPSRVAGATEHAVPLVVLAEILGGPAGRLHKRLIQNGGIAASASAWYDDVAVDTSRFSLSISPKQGKTVSEAEAALDKTIAELLKDGVTAAEVARARTNLLAQAVFARDSSYVAVRAFGEALTAGLGVADVEAWPDLVGKVTAEQILAAARHVFDRRGSVTGVLLPEPAS